MPAHRAQQRATIHVRTPRVCSRGVEKLTRVREHTGDPTSRTLYFTMPNRTRARSQTTPIDAANVPEFEGEEAWFEVEQVERGAGRPWPWWRAVRQVEPPEIAR